MERESFIFYRSFYDAIKCMPSEVQAEIYPAICEYALFGRVPKSLSDVAKGMFTLIKPNIDVNTARFVNGSKGGRKGNGKGNVKKPAPADSDYSLTYEQEVDAMRVDEDWRKTICSDFSITAEEYDSRLTRFLARCHEDSKRKGKVGHDSAEDAKSHLRYWMSKAFPQQHHAPAAPPIQDDEELPPPPDYTFSGGFGGEDID